VSVRIYYLAMRAEAWRGDTLLQVVSQLGKRLVIHLELAYAQVLGSGVSQLL
jgi:hypothetical protein